MSSNLKDGARNDPRETADRARPQVLVTGANGLIGGFVMNAWRAPDSRFDPVGLARSAGPNADIVADIAISTPWLRPAPASTPSSTWPRRVRSTRRGRRFLNRT